jgi:hypothetical protein
LLYFTTGTWQKLVPKILLGTPIAVSVLPFCQMSSIFSHPENVRSTPVFGPPERKTGPNIWPIKRKYRKDIPSEHKKYLFITNKN